MMKTKWKDAPKMMYLKRAIDEAGAPGLILGAEIELLKFELAAKDAAIDLLSEEVDGLRERVSQLVHYKPQRKL